MKTFTGKVISASMQHTAVVEVTRRWTHPLYKKTVKRTKKYHVHDPKNELQTGDTISFHETKPLSKTVRFTLNSVIHTNNQQ